jgi:hypothetical protein
LLDQLLLNQWRIKSPANAESIPLPQYCTSIATAPNDILLDVANQLGRAYFAPAVKKAILGTDVRQWQRALGSEYEPVVDFQGQYPGVEFKGAIPAGPPEPCAQTNPVLASGIKLILASSASISVGAAARLALKFPRDLVAYESLTLDRDVATRIAHWCHQAIEVQTVCGDIANFG